MATTKVNIKADPQWYSFVEEDGNIDLHANLEFENPDRKQFYGTRYPTFYNEFLDIEYTKDGHSLHHTLMQKRGPSNSHYAVFDSEEGLDGNLYVLMYWMKTVYLIGRLNPENEHTKKLKKAILKKPAKRPKHSESS